MQRVVIKRYDSQLINEEGQIANRYERGEASSYKQEKYTKTNKQANKYNMAKQQEKNDEIKERKVKDILLSPYVILNNNDDFEIFISKAKADMFNIPVLNLDLSGLDNNTTYDVSSFNKCWKSPEEVRLSCSGRVILAKYFSKLSDIELIDHRLNSMRLDNLKKFSSEPNFASIKKYQTQSNYFSVFDDNSKFRSELDLRNNKINQQYGLRDESDKIFENLTVNLLNKNDSNNYYDNSYMYKKISINDKWKLSLSEQKHMINQLKKIYNLDYLKASSLSQCSFLHFSYTSNKNMNIISSNNIILDKDMNKDMNKMLSSYNINEKLISENIQKYDSPYIINIAKNYIQRKNTKQKLSNAKFMKQLSSSYPNIERIKELWHNENNQLKEGNRKKYLWFNLKKCDSVYELKQINDILSLPTKQFQFWNDNNITNYEEKLCKQNFIVQDKCQQKSMSFIKENNYSNILPIQIKKNRKNNMINNQQIPILIEKIYTNNTINLMLDQDWKIYPRSNRTHLNLDFFLRKQSTLYFLNACLLMLKILNVMQIRNYIYIVYIYI